MKVSAFILFVLIAFSCNKNNCDESPENVMVTVEAKSKGKTNIEVSHNCTKDFDENYRTTFPLKNKVITVKLHSEKSGHKSIIIYLNNEMVVKKASDCDLNDYELTYNLDNF